MKKLITLLMIAVPALGFSQTKDFLSLRNIMVKAGGPDTSASTQNKDVLQLHFTPAVNGMYKTLVVGDKKGTGMLKLQLTKIKDVVTNGTIKETYYNADDIHGKTTVIVQVVGNTLSSVSIVSYIGRLEEVTMTWLLVDIKPMMRSQPTKKNLPVARVNTKH